MFRRKLLLYNEAGDKDGGAPQNSNPPPPVDDKKPATPDPKDPPKDEAKGNLDEYGYEKVSQDDQSGKEGKGSSKEGEKSASKEEKKQEEKIEPASGYGDEPPAVDEKIEDPPKEEIPPKDEGLGYELDVKDLAKEAIDSVTAFAKEHKLTKEQAQAFVEKVKIERSALEKAENQAIEERKRAIAKQKADWHKELKEDPVFGKENFVQNVARVDKFLGEFMGDTKKVLTERKSMLPPYVMRDILKVADLVYANDTFVNGDEGKGGGKPASDSKEEKKPWDYYT